MAKAVHEWDSKTGRCASPSMGMESFASIVGIPYKTFKAYACQDKSKRRTLGVSTGPERKLFSKEDSKFIADVARRHDRSNDGLTNKQLLDKIQKN